MMGSVPNDGLAVAIDCGGEFLSVALASYRETKSGLEIVPIDSFLEHRGHRHADIVLGELAAMLARHELPKDGLRMVAAGRGPGGFTGVRVGLATAQGVAMGLDIPFWGGCSLETIALNLRHEPGLVASLIDAKRGQVYAALFEVDQNRELRCVSEPEVADPVPLVAKYTERAMGRQIHFIGSGALAYELATDLDEALHQPSALSTLDLAIRQWASSGFLEAGMSVDPIYLRRSDAEIDYERRHGKDTGSA